MAREKAKVRINPVKFLKLIIVLIVICGLLVGAGYMLGKRLSTDNQREELSAVVLQNQIANIKELGTVTYEYTELGQYESSKDFYGTKIPFTTSKFIITYDGTIKAGIDMNLASVEIDEITQKIEIVVPAAKILSHEIHEESVKVFDEKNSIFNALTVADYASFYADQKKEVESKAKTQGLLSQARTQAKLAVQELVTPVLPEGWELEIK